MFSHEVHDVAQRRHVQGVALQCRHHRAQPLDDLGVASLREREVLTAVFGIALAMLKRVWHCARLARKVPRHGEHLVTEHGELFRRHIFLGDTLLNVDGFGAQAQIVRPPMVGVTAKVGEVDKGEQRGGEPSANGGVVPFRDAEQVRHQLLNAVVPDACGSAVASISSLRQPLAHPALPPPCRRPDRPSCTVRRQALPNRERSEHFSAVQGAK